MEENWIPLHEVDFNDESILQYHVDTRDFHVLCEKEPGFHKFPIEKGARTDSDFFHTGDEIKVLLNRYYEESGGEEEWRFFTLSHELLHKRWLKYLRIYRNDIGLVVCHDNFGEHYAISKEKLSSKAIG